jgi:hypothetical protein
VIRRAILPHLARVLTGAVAQGSGGASGLDVSGQSRLRAMFCQRLVSSRDRHSRDIRPPADLASSVWPLRAGPNPQALRTGKNDQKMKCVERAKMYALSPESWPCSNAAAWLRSTLRSRRDARTGASFLQRAQSLFLLSFFLRHGPDRVGKTATGFAAARVRNRSLFDPKTVASNVGIDDHGKAGG